MDARAVLADAKAAKDAGATRFCMGAAWRSPKDKDLDAVCAMVEGVKALGMETCVTLGMLTRRAGANAEAMRASTTTTTTSTPRRNITARSSRTRTYQDRLDTLARCARPASMSAAAASSAWARAEDDRVGMIHALATLPEHPESVPINMLMQVEGTPLGRQPRRSMRSISCAPSRWRASPCRNPSCGCRRGASDMSDETQALCFLAGANSIFYGDQAADHAQPAGAIKDTELFERLGITAMAI